MKIKTACLVAALATAGLSTAGIASAQSKVELYGIIDVGIEAYNNAPDGAAGKRTNTGMRSGGLSGSRWGLRGTEDLGNGLKAVFALEGGFNVGNGRDNGLGLFGRQAYVGLQGDWGTLTFGRQYTSGFNMWAPFVPGAYGTQYEPIARISPSRADNAVKYAGQFGGLKLGAYYSFMDQSQQSALDLDATGAYGAAIGYSYENRYHIMAMYDRINVPAGPTAAGRTLDLDNYGVGARVDFGPVKVLGGWRKRTQERLGQDKLKSDFYMIGAGYQVNPNTGLGVAYYYEKFKNGNLPNMVAGKNNWQQLSFLASYGLSKRTNVYAVLGHARNGPLNLGGAGDGGTAYALGTGATKQTGFGVGLRHMF